MVTIFSCPKSFEGKNSVVQKNAIKSWIMSCPRAEILLISEDKGVFEAAKELNVKHIPGIKKNEFGKPLLDSFFSLAKENAKNDILIYLSSDIILLSDFNEALKNINFPVYLMAGRRWDLDLNEEVNFNKNDWKEYLKEKVIRAGKLHGHCATDYIIFTKSFNHNMPPFAIGVAGWDNWLIFKAKSLKAPIIDSTLAIDIIHQNHDYNYSSFGKIGKLGGRIEGSQLKKNIALAGNSLDVMTLIDADFILDKTATLKKPPFPRNVLAKISLFYFWRILRSFRRKLRYIFSI